MIWVITDPNRNSDVQKFSSAKMILQLFLRWHSRDEQINKDKQTNILTNQQTKILTILSNDQTTNELTSKQTCLPTNEHILPNILTNIQMNIHSHKQTNKQRNIHTHKQTNKGTNTQKYHFYHRRQQQSLKFLEQQLSSFGWPAL